MDGADMFISDRGLRSTLAIYCSPANCAWMYLQLEIPLRVFCNAVYIHTYIRLGLLLFGSHKLDKSTHSYYNYKNKNWLQFLFIVKAAVLKQQIPKFYPQIQRTEDSDHIYFSQRPFINVKAIFCA